MSGPGYFVFAPARLTGGSIVVVNRGFVPEGRQDPKMRAAPSGVVDIVGVMRWPEQRGQFTPQDEPAKGLWFARDPAAMAAVKEMGHDRAVLRRSGGAAACRGTAENRTAEAEPAEQSSAICGNMVWSRAGDPDRGDCLLARAAARRFVISD